MTRTFGVACAAVLGLAAWASGDDKPRGEKEPFSDAVFVKKAAIGGMHEVALGKLAQTNAARPEVKKFGERLVADHSKANEKLMAIAKAAGIMIPSDMPEEKKKELEKFQGLKGADFDREFVRHQIKDHEMDIKLFTVASEHAQNADLKAFAKECLPTLKEHLEMAKKLGGDRTGAGGGQ